MFSLSQISDQAQSIRQTLYSNLRWCRERPFFAPYISVDITYTVVYRCIWRQWLLIAHYSFVKSATVVGFSRVTLEMTTTDTIIVSGTSTPLDCWCQIQRPDRFAMIWMPNVAESVVNVVMVMMMPTMVMMPVMMGAVTMMVWRLHARKQRLYNGLFTSPQHFAAERERLKHHRIILITFFRDRSSDNITQTIVLWFLLRPCHPWDCYRTRSIEREMQLKLRKEENKVQFFFHINPCESPLQKFFCCRLHHPIRYRQVSTGKEQKEMGFGKPQVRYLDIPGKFFPPLTYVSTTASVHVFSDGNSAINAISCERFSGFGSIQR